MAKKSVSERIRTLLAQGYSVKEISKKLKCSAGLVYQVRAYDKKKEKSVKRWESGVVTTSANKIKSQPSKGYIKTGEAARKQRDDMLNALATRPGAIRYGDSVLIPLPHHHMKPTLWQRVKNFFTGC